MTRSAPINVKVSPSLRHAIELAKEASGRTLTAEVEARIRHSLDAPGGDNLILLKLDDGLMAHVEALTRCHFVGNLEQTTIFMIRSQIISYMENKNWREMIIRNLRQPYRGAWS